MQLCIKINGYDIKKGQVTNNVYEYIAINCDHQMERSLNKSLIARKAKREGNIKNFQIANCPRSM